MTGVYRSMPSSTSQSIMVTQSGTEKRQGGMKGKGVWRGSYNQDSFKPFSGTFPSAAVVVQFRPANRSGQQAVVAQGDEVMGDRWESDQKWEKFESHRYKGGAGAR